MHKYRHAARYNAWYDSPDDQTNINFPLKNPFAKRRPQRRTNSSAEIEEGHGTGMFDDNGEPLRQTMTDEVEGQPSYAHGYSNFAGKPSRNAATMPDATSNPSRNQPDDSDIQRSESPVGDFRHGPEQDFNPVVKRSDDSGDTLNGSQEKNSLEPSRTSESQMRHRDRKGLKALFKKNTHEVEDDKSDREGKETVKKTPWSQVKATIFNSWINILLIASPIGFALNYAHVNPVAVFVVNFIAIIPLAGMLSYATEEIAFHTGEVLGGLLNASFGNAVELIVSIIALAKDQVLIVQTSLIGSMLSNLLLVMGMSFFFGGINRYKQEFNLTVAQTASSLLFLAVASLIIPTAFEAWARTGDTTSTENLDVNNPKYGVAQLSRATAILLLIVYACYLFFQLKSHVRIYTAPSNKNATRDVSGKMKNMLPEKVRRRSVQADSASKEEKSDEEEVAQLTIPVAVLTLAASTVLVAFNAEFLVDSINAITCGGGISKNFVGLILLPIVGNAAEHATAVTVAIKDKMDLAIGVAVGSSMQIALLVLPFVVVLGWIMGKDNMTLFFDGFQIAVLFVAVLLVNYLIQDGESHWLEGVLLMVLYIIIAVAAWFYPTAPGLSDCPNE